jgi:integrase/recombinase XerC
MVLITIIIINIDIFTIIYYYHDMSPTELNPRSIAASANNFIRAISLARATNTTRTYNNGMRLFLKVLLGQGLDPDNTPIVDLNEEYIIPFINYLKDYSPSSERLYISAVASYYEYLAANNSAVINLPRLKLLIRQRARRPGQRLPQFPRDAIEELITLCEVLLSRLCESRNDRLRNLRDRAFLITLADTGLRVHEACNLRRGDLDWNEGRAIIIGKGDRQAVVRFSRRAQDSIKDYFSVRAELDGNSGRPLSSLPVFSRHDRGAGKKIKPITTTTGRNIVTERVKEFLGAKSVGKITPHSFRHYFVTRVLASSGNLKLAQELARHRNIAVTQRYAHLSDNELDQGYWEIFEAK